MGFTVHWLNQTTLERTSKGLACRRMYGKHTYDNIAEMIDKVLSEFNIQNKTSLIVTDNAANFVKAFRYSTYYLYFIHDKLNNLPCAIANNIYKKKTAH